MSVSKLGHYLFLLGVVLAVVTAIVGDMGMSNMSMVLVVLGLIVGFVNVSNAESRTFLIAGIAFLATAGALNDIPHLGDYLGAIGNNLTLFTAPAVLIVALKSLISVASD